MGTMTTDETYNGYANRETWAFNLHWSNDEGMYATTLEHVSERVRDYRDEYDGGFPSTYQLGEWAVGYWRDALDMVEDEAPSAMPAAWRMFQREVGSWWRIDYREVGEAVREALEADTDMPDRWRGAEAD